MITRQNYPRRFSLSLLLVATSLLWACSSKPASEGESGQKAAAPKTVEILNVSYDPTRELYRQYNEAFAKHWKEKTGQEVIVRQSHGGSGGQARAVIDGLEADVVTLALAADVDANVKNAGLIKEDWLGTFPKGNAPYTSTLAFLVRKGNPKNIRNWDDLTRPDVEVITPNPKTSGVARWNYLAAWGYALQRELGDDFIARLSDPAHAAEVEKAQAAAQEYIRKLFKNVPVLDTGARGATNTFVQRAIGDVLINWENEILLGSRELDAAGLEMVIPSVSILAEPTVAVVDKIVDKRGTREVATAYLEYLYSDEGQDIAGRFYYRPTNPEILAKYKDQFPDLKLFSIAEVFGGWDKANEIHFADGGTFDQIYAP
jgi:sulfate/thiosulfate-binding protein